MSIDFEITAAGLAVVTINRPEQRNALDGAHYQALAAAWARVRDDRDIRVAIVTGAGDKAFCAGGDIKTHAGRDVDGSAGWGSSAHPMLNRGIDLWKPVIAAVNGYCLGAGLNLMLATDIRVACEAATFGASEVKRGLLPGGGGTQRLAQQLPHAIAMEILLTGQPVTAAQALAFGLINRLVPTWSDVLPAAMRYAELIAANAPLAVQASKELALRSRDLPLEAGLRLEQLALRAVAATQDAAEGRSAFMEKRPPTFTGR
ncbi:enoyl-CoA hydratase-related protein [Phenylobacterium sp. SCN 70-31]|uniref:enoyl-CoA hydratase/isomerase family protein n=1 Tax=Phenylobacterium sp. SCN 70-31 TaxID=1660129 RepID=UPI000868F960|nr:enoyl-CoA hydratase-related protein [Phenylobacterium sp. SCN 70-31]ODT88310.1 MAG: enoyl-CoA hydratase [Phenylobacterium sp. SCN 70-31]